MKKINVNLQDSSYPIFLGKDIISQNVISEFCKNSANRFVLIYDKNLKETSEKIIKEFDDKNLDITAFEFVALENKKTRKTKEELEDRLLDRNFKKDTLIMSLGGGITSDLSGFLASTYLRGIPFIMIPTTLLAMVDTSIGGKCAVNTRHGKNLIGSICQPKAVFIDYLFLKTLSAKEHLNGRAEIIKHALIADEKLLNEIDCLSTEKLIEKNILIKKEIVEKDISDKNIRKSLNFAHTIAHAVEKASDFKVSHGKAVLIGTVLESFLSYKMNLLKKEEFFRILSFFKKQKMLFDVKLDKYLILQAIKYDKKSINNTALFVLLKKIGQVKVDVLVDKDLILHAIDFANEGYRLC